MTERHCAETYRRPPPSCQVSHVWKIALGAGLGEPPVWMLSVAPSAALLRLPDPAPEIGGKTIWIVHHSVQGEVKLTGRRLDGPGVAVFPLYDRDPNFYEQFGTDTYERRWDRTELVLVPPHGAEHRTEVYIPGPGCWQFTARTETETVKIVKYLYPPDAP